MKSKKTIHPNGDIIYQIKGGLLHRENGPAIIRITGEKSWCRNGKCHREDGPAFITSNNDKYWYQYGELHREDGPAINESNGTEKWFLKGQQILCDNQEQFVRFLKLKSLW